MQALLEIDHTLAIREHLSPSDIESCSSEIAEYLADHANWPQPIFPDQSECSPLLFVPEKFDVIGTYWDCGSPNTEGNLRLCRPIIRGSTKTFGFMHDMIYRKPI